MKKILLAFALVLIPGFASAQCSGVFPANTVCGATTSAPPKPIASTSLPAKITVNSTTISGGTSLRVLYDNAGTVGEYTNAQVTALINLATTSLSGALPAWPNTTTTFFRGDGTYATLNCAALTNGSPSCSTDTTNATNITSGTLAAARMAAFGSGDVSFAIAGGAGTIAANAVTNAKAAQAALNTMKGNWTAGTANVADNTIPSCVDSGGNHLNYVNGTGITCGITSSGSATTAAITSDTTLITAGNNSAGGILQNQGGVLHDTGANQPSARTANINMTHVSTAQPLLPFIGSGTAAGLNTSYDGLGTSIIQAVGPTDSTAIFPQMNLVSFAYGTDLTAPGALLSSNAFGGVVGWGYDSASFKRGSSITLNATENWSVGSNGSGVSIYGTPNGSTLSGIMLGLTPALASIVPPVLMTGSAAPFSPAGFGNGYINFDTLNGGLNFQASTIIHPSATSFYNYFQWNPAELQWSTNCLSCQSGASQQVVARIPNNLLNFEIGNERFIRQTSATSITDGSQLVLSDAFTDGVITGLGSITGGSGYTNGTYTNVLLTTGGRGHQAQGTVVVSGGAVTSVNITCGPPTVAASCYAGFNYNVGDTLSASTGLPAGGIGPAGSGFSVPVTSISSPTVTGPSVLFIANSNQYGNFWGFGQNSAANGDNTLRLGVSANTSFPWQFSQVNEVNFALSGAVKFQTDNGATTTAVCGTQLQYLSSNGKLNLTICQPVATLTIAAAGSGGTPGTYSNVAAVSNYGHSLTVNVTVNGSGVVSAATVGNNAGTGYNVGELITFASGIGGTTGVTLSVATLATTYAPLQTGAMTATGYTAGASAGLSTTKTVRAAGGGSDCTMIFTGGLLTGGSC